MDMIAFSTSVGLHKTTRSSFTTCDVTRKHIVKTTTSTSTSTSTIPKTEMSVSDVFQWRSQTKEAKELATSTGVYTVQCTEGTNKWNDGETSRLAALAMNFRLRQSSLSEKYRDLYATRRSAIIQSFGSHVEESYAVKFPARASASVIGRAEALRSCSRYFKTETLEQYQAEEYMFNCVEKQYKQMKVQNGVYSTLCADGRVKEDAEMCRISSLATRFRANQFSIKEKEGMKYDSIKEATTLGFGCTYEEKYFQKFPKCASAMRYSTGSYAAGVAGTKIITNGKTLSVRDIISSENVAAYWPSYLMRAAVEKKPNNTKWWNISETSTLKNYAPMSSAAVKWGIEGQAEAQKPTATKAYINTWTPRWKPKSSLLYEISSAN